MNTISYTTTRHLSKFLQWRGVASEPMDGFLKFPGHDEYNQLLNINRMFSNRPFGQPLDRTGHVHLPVKFDTGRPWHYSDHAMTLQDALAARVNTLSALGQPINILWSGGIDSTTIVNAFIANSTDLSQLRILYSPFSVYEHRDFVEKFLPQFPQIDLIDISGDVYLTQQFDGIFLTGDSGDETHASMDESFLDKFGYKTLAQPWREFFQQRNPDPVFLDFCDRYFSWATRPITTVLEARWWFYINSKMHCMRQIKLPFFTNYTDFVPDRLQGFFDCDEFECYITHNTDRIMATADYASWKQELKNYCYKIDGFDQWAKQKTKNGSFQFHTYTYKKMALNDQRSIFIMKDGTRVCTPGLPLLSQQEFDSKYGHTWDYVINEPI